MISGIHNLTYFPKLNKTDHTFGVLKISISNQICKSIKLYSN